MSHRSKELFALAWYTPEQWRLLKRTAVDAHLLDDTYQEWLEEGEKLIVRLRQENKTFVKCFVDVAELEQWCLAEGLPLNAASRSRYVAEVTRSENEQ